MTLLHVWRRRREKMERQNCIDTYNVILRLWLVFFGSFGSDCSVNFFFILFFLCISFGDIYSSSVIILLLGWNFFAIHQYDSKLPSSIQSRQKFDSLFLWNRSSNHTLNLTTIFNWFIFIRPTINTLTHIHELDFKFYN